MNKPFVVLVCAAPMMMGQALAADTVSMPPAVPVAPVSQAQGFDWSGFYAGVNAGYGSGNADVTDFQGGQADEPITGWLGGAQFGYNVAVDGVVLGAEADIQASDIGFAVDAGADTFEAGISSLGTVRARAGADLGGVLPYVTGGLAYGQISSDVTGGGGPDISETQWALGWTAGGGVEAAVTENVSIKAEYLYTDFGAVSFDDAGFELDARTHSVRGGFNFHF